MALSAESANRPTTADALRKRGRIEQRGDSLRVVVYAGLDPVTGRRSYLRETIDGTNKAAWRKAESARSRLVAQADKQQTATTNVRLGHAITEWLRTAELDDGTREMYRGYYRRNIEPVLGHEPLNKVTARVLETFYAELRRCRARCDGEPYIEHRSEGLHDCNAEKCQPHVCRPLAASTVRQIHSIISGTLSAAVRWEWTSSNPAKVAQKPKQKPPEPDPPTPAEAARLAEAAFQFDDDWGTLVWLLMTTGMRRGEACALRWEDIDLDEGLIVVRKSYSKRNKISKIKDTKTHQSRRIAIDNETIVLLLEYKQRYFVRCTQLGLTFSGEMYVFLGIRNPDPREPCPPDSVSRRYKTMADKLGIKTHVHALRHYSATELLTAGVDLRTVAGRLGHGGGGATTLRVYAAWVAAADRKAAEILGARLPKNLRKNRDRI